MSVWILLPLTTRKCYFHISSHDSQANMSLTDVPFLLLLLFVLILKAWHWQINKLSLGFQVSQQSLSSHADVSVGSDVCNPIAAWRESATLPFDPMAKVCILSSLAGCDAKLQSFNTARPPRLCTVAVPDVPQSSQNICYLMNFRDCFAVAVT